MKSLGEVEGILASANGTWLDRMEAIALRRHRHRNLVSSLAGHLAETYSVMPLAGIAAVLLTGRMPSLLGRDGLSDTKAPARFSRAAGLVFCVRITLTF